MKRVFDFMFLALAVFFFASCEPAEQGYTYERYLDDIYTVNKHKVRAEFSDSLIPVANMDKYGFSTGDRVRMLLRYHYDSQTMRQPEYEIHSAGEVIPTLPIVAEGSINAAEYNVPFEGLYRYEFNDRYMKPVWVWNRCQNINISSYSDADATAYAMTVRGVKDGCIELGLYAKSDTPSNDPKAKLLTFDLSNVADFLTEEQKSSIASLDSLRTRIFLTRKAENEIKEIDIIGGVIANPVK
ncbi:MAG: hypothetical protein IKJ95_02740 [Bacteroidaceae bacterium]|nr:hypothetical protein [Bacteroidaceae bacterium]